MNLARTFPSVCARAEFLPVFAHAWRVMNHADVSSSIWLNLLKFLVHSALLFLTDSHSGQFDSPRASKTRLGQLEFDRDSFVFSFLFLTQFSLSLCVSLPT